MPQVVVNQALVQLAAECLLLHAKGEDWVVHLWVGPFGITPQATDILSDYQLCTLPGYSKFALTPAEWKQQPSQPPVALWEYPLITFNFDNGGQTVYGYLVADTLDSIMWVGVFPAPYPVPPGGGSLPLTITWADEQCVDF